MNFPAMPGVLVHHNTKAKVYPDGSQRITVCSKPIFRSEGFEPVEFRTPDSKPKNMDNEVRDDSVKRAKERIFDIARCNEFTWFVTWTLDPDKVDRYNPDLVSKKLKKFLNNQVTRHNAKYLIIPEYHKDGAIHMHGLLSGNFQMVDSGLKTKDGKRIYNMPQWTLGYSTAIELDEHRERVSAYITKYVTKDFRKIFGAFYYAGGHGLVRKPSIQLYDVDYDKISKQEYSAKNVPLWFKYIKVDGEGDTDENNIIV